MIHGRMNNALVAIAGNAKSRERGEDGHEHPERNRAPASFAERD